MLGNIGKCWEMLGVETFELPTFWDLKCWEMLGNVGKCWELKASNSQHFGISNVGKCWEMLGVAGEWLGKPPSGLSPPDAFPLKVTLLAQNALKKKLFLFFEDRKPKELNLD